MGNAIKIKKNNEEYFLIDKDKNPFICNKKNISIFKINLIKEYIDKYNSLPPRDYKFPKPEILDLGLTCEEKPIDLTKPPGKPEVFIYDENEKTKKYLLADININKFEDFLLKMNVLEYEKKKLEFNNLNINEKKNTIMIMVVTSVIMSSLDNTEEYKKKIVDIINYYYESIIIIPNENNDINSLITNSFNNLFKTNYDFNVVITIYIVLFLFVCIVVSIFIYKYFIKK